MAVRTCRLLTVGVREKDRTSTCHRLGVNSAGSAAEEVAGTLGPQTGLKILLGIEDPAATKRRGDQWRVDKRME